MFELGEFGLPDQSSSCTSVWKWVHMDMRPSALLSVWPSWSRSILLFIYFFFFLLSRKEKSHNTEPHFSPKVSNLIPCCLSCPGLWPPEQIHPSDNRGQVGRDGWTWEGWMVTWVARPNLSMTSHPLLAAAWPVPHGLFMARWDAAGRGGTHYSIAPTQSPTLFEWFCQVLRSISSVWGAAVGGAGCGGHGHGRGAWGGHRLADVGHEEGIAGQLVHVDAVLLTVD